MRRTPEATHAIVREIPASYDRCIQPHKTPETIDVKLARRQHALYCDVLADTGLRVTRLPREDAHPDSCFVEDPVVVLDTVVVVNRMGAASRRGEEAGIAAHLPGRRREVVMAPPATLEGGDVLRIGQKLYVGRSGRTNAGGVDFLRVAAETDGLEVIAVELGNVLHLKSVVSWLGEDTVVVADGDWDAAAFMGYNRVPLSAADGYAANCRAVNGTVLVPAGYPEAGEAIEAAGFATRAVEVSEFRKGGGGLSCLSLLVRGRNPEPTYRLKCFSDSLLRR